LLFRLRADAAQWGWGLRFLTQCLPAAARRNTIACLALAADSRSRLQALRAQLELAYDHVSRGILQIFTDHSALAAACTSADLLAQHGVTLAAKSAAECLAIEPALDQALTPVVGGLYCAEDESGDAHKFTQALARCCGERGVEFVFDTQLRGLDYDGDRVTGVRAKAGERDLRMTADSYVLALGSYSPRFTAPLGLKLPVYPVKGYSITVPLRPADRAPNVCLTDEARKMAFSRLGDRLRVAGTAELNGYDQSINPARCAALVERLHQLFPRIERRDDVLHWSGLRPATPGNVPIIGATRYRNLFLNTGHGTLGWTMACGSGYALSELIAGRQPSIAFPFTAARSSR
jgi:D-amino-acid dehydrogenase